MNVGIFSSVEKKMFKKAFDFLWKVRIAMHKIQGRGQNTLTFDLQLKIAEMFEYENKLSTYKGSARENLRGVEKFMREYFLTIRNTATLSRVMFSHLEKKYNSAKVSYKTLDYKSLNNKGLSYDCFILDGGRLAVRDVSVFKNFPIKILEVFRILEITGLDINQQTLTALIRNVDNLKSVRNSIAANEMFVDIVAGEKNPERVLRLMNESRVIQCFMPEWKNIECQMQYDMYHTYTTDEHTIRAIGYLHKIEAGKLREQHPLSTKLMANISDRKVLYVAVLLHDIAKGLGGDHSKLGQEIAKKIAVRLGFDSVAVDTIATLVRNHLLLVHVSQRRDISDIKTLEDFVKTIASISHLNMLTVLSVVDLRAVGAVWNNWKADFPADFSL
jgi:[protein-PII] uridylyltransferase